MHTKPKLTAVLKLNRDISAPFTHHYSLILSFKTRPLCFPLVDRKLFRKWFKRPRTGQKIPLVIFFLALTTHFQGTLQIVLNCPTCHLSKPLPCLFCDDAVRLLHQKRLILIAQVATSPPVAMLCVRSSLIQSHLFTMALNSMELFLPNLGRHAITPDNSRVRLNPSKQTSDRPSIVFHRIVIVEYRAAVPDRSAGFCWLK